MANYTWTLPHFPSGKEHLCVLRLRYNISSNDYHPHRTFAPVDCFDGSCYSVSSRKGVLSWAMAQKECRKFPGRDLAVVETEEENEYLKQLLKKKNSRRNYWMALGRTSNKGEWVFFWLFRIVQRQ